MQTIRKFKIISNKSPEGFEVHYTAEGFFCGTILHHKPLSITYVQIVLNYCLPTLQQFLTAAKQLTITNKEAEVIELQEEITFEMMWQLYNDKNRSSKKLSLIVWNKLKKEDQVKAYYHYPMYDRHRGNAEKKHLPTYLRAELWNNN